MNIFADYNKFNEDEHLYKSLDFLNLSTVQHYKIKNILIEFKYNYNEFYEFKERREKKLKKIMKNDSFDKRKYIMIKQEILNHAIKLEVNIIEKIHNILDKHQRKKFSKYLEEWEVE
jgi:Spy/CpxP family protein refolding chaperone